VNWLRSSTDDRGIKTTYPPMPKYEDMLRCSQCNGVTQFLHFFPEILKYLKDDAKVPSFCSGICAERFLKILSASI